MAYQPVPSKQDDGSFSVGTDNVTPSGFLFDDVATDSVDEGDVGLARMSGDRIVYQRVQDGHDATLGSLADAAVADASGSVNAHLRQIAKQLAASVAVTGSGNFAVTQADGSSVTLGALADAAVGDASGSVNAHLRQIAKLLAATLVVSGTGNFQTTAADGSSVTLGALADAAVGDASGSVNAHLRQIAKSLAATLTISGTVAVSGVSGNITVVQGTATNLKVDASGVAVPVTDNSGSLTVDDGGGSLTVDGTVAVSGTVTADTELTTADLDTGAGTDTRAVVGLVIAKSGGAVNLSNTDPMPVSDAGGSLTVDGAVTVSGTATVSGTVSVDTITTSVVPGTAATHLGKAEDAPHTSGDTGVLGLAVRNDTRGTLAGTDLDYAPPQVNASGDLRVEPFSLGAAASLGKTEDAAHTTADVGVLGLSVRNDTLAAAGLAGTTLDNQALQTDATGKLWTTETQVEDAGHTTADKGALVLTVRNDSGAATGLAGTDLDYQAAQSDAAGNVKVNVNAALPTGTNSLGDVRSITTSVVPGTSATHLGKAEDAGHTSGDTGVMALAVRSDTRGTLAGTDLDYAPFQLNSSGELRVDPSRVASNSGSFTGNGQTLAITLAGQTTATLEVTGTWTGIIGLQGCDATGTLFGLTGISQTTKATRSSLVSTNDTIIYNCSGFATVQALATTIASGSATVVVRVADSAPPIYVIGINPGVDAASFAKGEDLGHTSGDVGVMTLSVRNDAAASTGLAGTDLDYQALQSDAQGRVRVAEALPVVVTGTLTRPANTTPYTINDEMTDTSGNILAITGCARYNGGAGYIEAITVINDQNEATAANLDIFIFDTTSTPAADNAAFGPTDAVMKTIIVAKNLGTKFSGDTAAGGNAVFQLSGLRIPFVCGGSSTSLFVRFAVRNAFTATANSSTFTTRLHIFQT